MSVEQYKVAAIGRIPSIAEQLYAITTERRLTHPAIVAIQQGREAGCIRQGRTMSTGRRSSGAPLTDAPAVLRGAFQGQCRRVLSKQVDDGFGGSTRKSPFRTADIIDAR